MNLRSHIDSPAVTAFVLVLALGLLSQEPRKLTIAEVVQIASSESKEVQIAEKSVEAAEARTAATRSQLYPALRAEGNVFVWNKKIEIETGGPEPLTVRSMITSQASVTVAQPLTGLFALLQLVDVERLGREAAEADRDGVRLDATQRAAEAFLGALEARAVLEVSEKSLKQVDAQLGTARAFEQAGVLGTVDVLRIESTRASVLQDVLRARSDVAVADGALLLTLDWPQGTAIAPVDDLPDPPPKVTLAPELLRERAAKARPELASAKKRIDQASAGKTAAYAGFIPDVAAVGTYQHTEGFGTFQERDAAFGGATLSWNIFEWGRTLDEVNEAGALLEQAELRADATLQQVEFDVHRRSLETGTTFETLAVAQSGLRAAEEAYRIQTARYEQGAATTTDLLDAETEVARARTTYASARYQYFVALAALARSLGELPSL